jgi:hypothetical protein
VAGFGLPRVFYFPDTRHIRRAFPSLPPVEASDGRPATPHGNKAKYWAEYVMPGAMFCAMKGGSCLTWQSLEAILCSVTGKESACEVLSFCFQHWHSLKTILCTEMGQLFRIYCWCDWPVFVAVGETADCVTAALQCTAPLIHLIAWVLDVLSSIFGKK